MEVLHCCEEMGMLRSRHTLQERAAVCFVLWSEGAAKQRLAERKVEPTCGLSYAQHGRPCSHTTSSSSCLQCAAEPGVPTAQSM